MKDEYTFRPRLRERIAFVILTTGITIVTGFSFFIFGRSMLNQPMGWFILGSILFFIGSLVKLNYDLFKVNHVTITPDGIRYNEHGLKVFVPWNNITEFGEIIQWGRRGGFRKKWGLLVNDSISGVEVGAPISMNVPIVNLLPYMSVPRRGLFRKVDFEALRQTEIGTALATYAPYLFE